MFSRVDALELPRVFYRTALLQWLYEGVTVRVSKPRDGVAGRDDARGTGRDRWLDYAVLRGFECVVEPAREEIRNCQVCLLILFSPQALQDGLQWQGYCHLTYR